MNKSGFAELIIVFVFIFFVAILFFFLMKVTNSYSDSVSLMPESNVTATAAAGIGSGFNVGIIMAVGLLFVGAIITALVLDVNPVWIWIGFMVFVIVIYSLSKIAPVTSVIVNNVTMAREINQAPQANGILQNIPVILVGLGVIFFVAMYTKMRSRP